MNKTLVLIIRWLIILAMPVLIVLLSARIMVNTWYPSFEYAKANFPPDLFGFTQAQRLEFGTISINFLNAPEPPEVAVKMLEALRLPGTDQPMFTIYENQHMVDVKRLMDQLWRVLAIAAGVVDHRIWLSCSSHAARAAEGYAAIFGGGLLTTGLLTALILLVLLAWNWFFVAFHGVFFDAGTWTFNWSDSLIRLFPDKFWFDAGVLLVGGALVAGVIVMGVGYVLGRRART